ncbi:hypothetical protein L5515_016563 [Caenorhabditis briggsae]|uniref:Uncharacterized protein n=1 Tax=Caenorhabditis briggsae TaxID=6238 RepID=A0AAE9FBW9_CAEBR|nr:hypothetical protein L5515_016563 [Caenorhabditis briggsae]
MPVSFQFSVLLVLAFGISANAQFFFQQPFNFFNAPQRPFQLFAPTTPPTTTTTVEFIPDPDREQGNFPMPNPANWPVGPDWNDPRNNNQQQLGWGGNGLIGTTSTRPSIVVSTTTTTVQPPTTSVAAVIISSTTIHPIAVMTKKPLITPAKKQSAKKRFSPRKPLVTAAPTTPLPPTPKPKTRIMSASKRRATRKSKSSFKRRSH